MKTTIFSTNGNRWEELHLLEKTHTHKHIYNVCNCGCSSNVNLIFYFFYFDTNLQMCICFVCIYIYIIVKCKPSLITHSHLNSSSHSRRVSIFSYTENPSTSLSHFLLSHIRATILQRTNKHKNEDCVVREKHFFFFLLSRLSLRKEGSSSSLLHGDCKTVCGHHGRGFDVLPVQKAIHCLGDAKSVGAKQKTACRKIYCKWNGFLDVEVSRKICSGSREDTNKEINVSLKYSLFELWLLLRHQLKLFC